MKANFPDLIVEQLKTLTRVQNNAGCQIDPLVPSIQTVGTKTKGFIYADNNQPNTAWTIKSDYVGDSTEIVINDASVFERIDMKDILGKLQNLVKSEYISIDPLGYGKREFTIPDHIDVSKIISITASLYLTDKGYRHTIPLMCSANAENMGTVGESISQLTIYRIPYTTNRKFTMASSYATQWLIQTVFISYYN